MIRPPVVDRGGAPRRRRMRVLALAGAVMFGQLTAGPMAPRIAVPCARAQPAAPTPPAPPTTDAVRAAEQFDLALKRKRAGDWAGACEAFAASQRLEPAVGTQLNLADCLQRDGQLLAAAAMLRDAAATAAARGDVNREQRARADLAAIEARLPTFTVILPPGAGVVKAMLDGVILDDLARPIAVDPGAHRWLIAIDGEARFQRDLVIGEGQAERIEVPARATTTTPTTPPVIEPPPAPPPRRRSRALALGLGAGAVALAGGGVALLVTARGLQDRADTTCPDPLTCDDVAQAQDYNDRAVQRSQIGVAVLAGAGAVAIAAGVAWWRAGRPDDGPRPALAVAPGSALVTVGGRF